MICPHCLHDIVPSFQVSGMTKDIDGFWEIEYMICPNTDCEKLIAHLNMGIGHGGEYGAHYAQNIVQKIMVYPFSSSRPPVPKDVDGDIANDYTEACLVLPFSPKSSAALSRRCLQNLLRKKTGIKHGELSSEIDQVIKDLPSYLADDIDAVRNIGNFAAHPIKSKETGEIVDVEEGEAEWTLDVLESLFDFYYVQPAAAKLKRDALNEKLKAAGKPEMK